MAFDMHDGRLWVADVGHQVEEEVSIATAGANLGWPAFEGANCFTVLRGLTDRDKEFVRSYRCGEVNRHGFTCRNVYPARQSRVRNCWWDGVPGQRDSLAKGYIFVWRPLQPASVGTRR